MLKVHHFIGWLVLNNNSIGDSGIKNLATGISKNKSLKHLILSNNHITQDSLETLFDSLHSSRKQFILYFLMGIR